MATLREQVWHRAAGRCEYCRMPQSLTVLPHELDHVRAQKHHGETSLENLCLACAPCNAHKGPNLTGIDPDTGALTALFDPRSQRWEAHFEWDGPVLLGRTPEGRTTIDVLTINAPEREEHRRLLIASGRFP